MWDNLTIFTPYSSEPELLSLLNTAEIKTLGGEVLLTWGGDTLARILNPAEAHAHASSPTESSTAACRRCLHLPVLGACA